MPKSLIVALIAVSLTVPVLAAETFYVIFDNTLKGCTVVTSEPSDKIRYEVLGKYNSETDAEKAMPSHPHPNPHWKGSKLIIVAEATSRPRSLLSTRS